MAYVGIRLIVAILLVNRAGAAAPEAPLPPPRPPEFSGAAAVPLPSPRPPEFAPVAPPATEVPLPPGRPAEWAPVAPPAPELPPRAATPEELAACDALVAGGTVIATRMAAIGGPNGCGVAAPVSLESVMLRDRRAIGLEPPAVVSCGLAGRLGDWVAQDVAPLLETQGRRIKRLVDLGGYQCRPRNGQPTNILSEHAHGDALDLLAVEFVDGGRYEFASRANDLTLALAIRTSACARFSTVLGPGADAAHEAHLHVDIEARRNGGKICQWEAR